MKRAYTKFHLRLFWSVIAAMLLLSLSFTAFQYIREKRHKIELLSRELNASNDYIYEEIIRGAAVEQIVPKSEARISVIDLDGNVIYDSDFPDVAQADNHSDRKEVRQAIEKGVGYDMRRSSLTGGSYFYSAKRYDRYIIRSAAPYDSTLASMLKVNPLYILIPLIIMTVFVIAFYNMMRHLGQTLNRLNDFANKAEHESIDEYTAHFPNDEVGEISRHIVQIYNRLQKTKQALLVEQKRVIEQQEEQARIKKQLTQNIAHELKTPVSIIQGYLETIINDQNLAPETASGFIDKCYRQSARLSSLLRDISTLTHIDEAPDMITKDAVDLSDLIAEALGDAALPMKEKHIKAHNRTEALQLACRGNYSLLYSVFRNLIDNSIAYAGEGSSIYIECNTEDPERYFFSYSDNGAGIPDEHLERIFERFYRIDKGRSRKAGGTGLGLSIVKNAILLHGGSIAARQRAGGGLEFVFAIKR